MLIMGRDHDRDADLVEAPEQAHDLAGQRGIEVAGRLVGHEQWRLAHDRARDADALLLAHRQLQRRDPLLAEQSHLVERGAHALVDFLERGVGDDQRQRDVIEYRPIHEQSMIL